MLLSLDALNENAFKPAFLAQRVEKERKAVLSELQMMNTIEYRYGKVCLCVVCCLLSYSSSSPSFVVGCHYC